MTALFQGRRGISPLVATLLLIAFSVGVGAVVMSVGESYIEEKAEFVQGVREVGTGCTGASLSVIMVQGVPQACMRGDSLELAMDNGPVSLSAVHLRAVGTSGLAVRENVLPAPWPAASAAQVKVALADAGEVRQVKLTPVVDGELCADHAVTLENIRAC